MLKSFFLFISALIFFLFLNVLDGHSTYLVVRRSSLRSERNPFARWVFSKLGLLKGIFALKGIIVLLLPLMFWVYKEEPKDINLVLIVANTAYSAVVINNYRNFLKIMKIIEPNKTKFKALKKGFKWQKSSL